jgi:thiosulfate/3-mercaptopyruvate sulfurtransferase
MSHSGFFRGFHKRQDLVSTKWLLERLGRPDIAIVDASVSKIDDIWLSGRAAFDAGHIPGARFTDLVSDFSDPEAPFSFTRPTAARLASAAGALELTNGRQIVVYDNTTGIWAARLWWLFKAFGHDEVSVLDGGLTAWLAESGPLERGPSVLEPTAFEAREQPGFFADQNEVLAIVEGRARGRLVCVLRPQVFEAIEQRYSRPGHIPLSVNLPYLELLGPDNRLLPEKALRNALAPLIARDERVILYCGGGVTAAGTALVLTLLGARDISIYTAPFLSGQPTPACQWSWASILTSRRAGRHEGPLVSQPCRWELSMA